MKKIVALVLALILTLAATSALAITCPICGVKFPEGEFGDPDWRPYEYPAMSDMLGAAKYDPNVNVKAWKNPETGVYRQVVTKGIDSVFGGLVDRKDMLNEYLEFNMTMKHAELLEEQETVTVLLRMPEPALKIRENKYRALVYINDEWVEVPVTVDGYNRGPWAKGGFPASSILAAQWATGVENANEAKPIMHGKDAEGNPCPYVASFFWGGCYALELTPDQLSALDGVTGKVAIILDR